MKCTLFHDLMPFKKVKDNYNKVKGNLKRASSATSNMLFSMQASIKK